MSVAVVVECEVISAASPRNVARERRFVTRIYEEFREKISLKFQNLAVHAKAVSTACKVEVADPV